ncbi:Armadillo-type fold [Phytophthora cactorum]|nr:Armadillo-type fold [Phytophthora cactorum]
MVGTTPTLAALLKSLRQASTDPTAFDRLISTHSLVEAQNLVFGERPAAGDTGSVHPASVLFKAFNANNDVLSGYLAALKRTLRTTVVRILVEALELVPHSQLSQATYRTHVTLLVDLLSSFATQTKEQVALAARTARFVLESVQILIGRNVGVVALLQSLGRLAQCVPEAFWSSVFLTSAAYFLVDKCETPMEQQLILNVLRETLDFGWDLVSGKRSVYVEILLLPLSFMMSVHGTTASALLQRLYGQVATLLLVALLSDARSSVRACAAKCLERQVKSSPKFWASSSALLWPVDDFVLVFFGRLAATTTDTMRIILRLIDSMNGTAKMRSMALKLMFEVWRNESHMERHVVRMATIKALCEKDPELGLESVVSMAMDAISALCGGDCLDFYVAFKIISQKMPNEKHALKLLDQTWEFADSEHPDVRKSAYAAMCNFPLDMLGLCMLDGANAGQESDDEDQMTEEEVEEQLDDLMRRLQSEHDPDVRSKSKSWLRELSNMRVKNSRLALVEDSGWHLQRHSKFPTHGFGRSSFRCGNQGDEGTSSIKSGAKAVIDTKNVKRKDKLVRLATQNVDELVETVTAVLQSMELPWTLTGTSTDTDEYCKVFIRTQALIEGWRGFMSTYVTSLDELAELKTPIGVDDADVAFRVFSEGVAGLLGSLLHDTSNKNPQLRLKYSETIEELSRLLALSIEKTRVFSADDNDARTSSVGALMALQLAFGRRKVDASEDCSSFCLQLEKTEKMFVEVYTGASDDVLVACALLGLSHIAALYSNGDELETFEVAQWRQQRVKPIAERILGSSCIRSGKASLLRPMETCAPLDKAMEASSSIERVAADFDQTSPGGILLRWTSLMGLVRLASGFSSIKRLDWLVNVRKVLADVWETSESASITAVALGPVLLHCVHFNVAHSSSLEKFVATSIQRAANSGAASLDRGFLLMAAAYVLCRLDSFGGGAVRSLALSAVANFFHLSFGISGSFVPGMLNMDGSVEITLDSETVAMLVESARTENGSERGLSNAVLGAIARAADKFYVSHKKKSFDVEIRTLPSNSLLAKTLEWLRDTNPSSESVAGTISETSVAVSLLDCLTSTDSVLPLLDYASLTHRVMLRFCSVDTSIACVKFAATQGSCDELLAGELLSSRWFGNADAALQAELITWISHAATRVPTDVLRTLLTTIFDILKDIWRRDTSSSSSVLLFDSWTAMLHDILDAEQLAVFLRAPWQW